MKVLASNSFLNLCFHCPTPQKITSDQVQICRSMCNLQFKVRKYGLLSELRPVCKIGPAVDMWRSVNETNACRTGPGPEWALLRAETGIIANPMTEEHFIHKAKHPELPHCIYSIVTHKLLSIPVTLIYILLNLSTWIIYWHILLCMCQGWWDIYYAFWKCLGGTSSQSPLLSTEHELLMLVLGAPAPHLLTGPKPQARATIHVLCLAETFWVHSLSLFPSLPETPRRLFSQNSYRMLNFCFEINDEQVSSLVLNCENVFSSIFP